MRATVLGTGIMGAAMARSLAREGHEVRVWNRTFERADAVAGAGITAHREIADAISGCDVVVAVGGSEDWGKGDYVVAFALPQKP